MILAIDVGNSQIEIGVFKADSLLKSWRIATGIGRTEDEYMVFIYHFLSIEKISTESLQGVAISSVVPNVTFIFEKMCRKYFKFEPVIIDYRQKTGLKIRYHDPAEVGADRLCSSIAAFQKFNDAVIVIDFGTATTLDVVNSEGEYMGGIIAPGLETTAWALYQRAAKLPKISLEFPLETIGRSTAQSMQSGIMIGAVKMIDGLLEEISKELNSKPHVVATGGLAKLIQPHSKSIEAYFPHLVLEGLYSIYKMNMA
jgi:type III pantothenate kinase